MNVEPVDSSLGPASSSPGGDDVLSWPSDLAAVFANAHSLARVFADSPVGLALSYGEDFRYRFVNEAFCRILGRPRLEIVGRNATELGLFDGEPDLRARARQAFFAEGRAVDISVRIPRADGSVGHALFSATASLPGEPASGVTALVDITDLQQAEVARRLVDARFSALVSQSRDLLILMDGQLGILYASSSVYKLLGASNDTPPQTLSFVPIMQPEIYDDSVAVIRASAATGRPGRFTSEFRAADGSLRIYDMLFDNRLDDPSIRAIVATGRDITELTDSQEALRRLDARFSALIAESPDVHIIADRSLSPIFLSPSAYRFLGFEPGAPIDERLVSGQPAEDLSALLHEMEAVRDRGATARIVQRVIDAGGSERWFDLVITNHLAEPSIAGIVIVGRDITEQRAADEAVRLRDRALNAMSLGYVVTDPTKARAPIVAVNPAFSRITGYPADELMGMRGLHLLGPDSDRSVITRLRAAVADGTDPVYRLRVYRKSGEPYWMELHTAPVVDGDGKLTHHVTTIEDITPRIAAEQESRTSAMLLEQAPAAVFGMTVGGVVTHWNRASEDLFRVARAEAIGACVVDVVEPPANGSFMRALVEVVAVGRARSGDLRLIGPNDSDLLVQVTTTPVDDLAGRGAGCIAVVVDITERFRIERELQRLALSDSLTGLANRTRFIDRLSVALNVLDPGEYAAVLLVDIDDFRRFNEALGIEAGDDALRLLARRLSDEVGGRGLVARFAGDRFAVMLDRATQQLGDVLSARVTEPIMLQDRPRYVTASIGMTLATAGSDAWTVINECDVAERQSTRQGSARVTRFQPGMGAQARRRLDLETDLRRALDEEQFRLVYQPLVDLRNRRLVGSEALIRWEHPERGPIGPADFIPFAEEIGLIVPIGSWVVAQACAMLRRLQDLHPGAPGPGIDLNLSPRQFRHDALVDDVAAAIVRSGIDPARLGIEVTETAASLDAVAAIEVLGGLRALGVQLALDDLGAGYSSLGILDRWPVQGLKLDRSLTESAGNDPRRAAIARAVTTLGQDLGMTITAEGIETDEQASAMASLGCNRGQGYHFSRPLTADALAAAVAADPFPRFPNLR